MRTYENDTDLKIPNWYYRLPLFVLNFMSNLGITLSRKVSKKEINRTNKRNIKFYL